MLKKLNFFSWYTYGVMPAHWLRGTKKKLKNKKKTKTKITNEKWKKKKIKEWCYGATMLTPHTSHPAYGLRTQRVIISNSYSSRAPDRTRGKEWNPLKNIYLHTLQHIFIFHFSVKCHAHNARLHKNPE